MIRETEIGICREGFGTLVLDQDVIPFAPGMISVIPQKYPHTTYSERGTRSFWEYLFLDPETLLKERFGDLYVKGHRIQEIIGRGAFLRTWEKAADLHAAAGLSRTGSASTTGRKKRKENREHNDF